jgi:flagellar motor switch protein FliM
VTTSDLIREAEEADRHSTEGAGPQPFDFRRPTNFSREHVRALQIVHEAFARQLSTVLSTTLRAVSQVSLVSVDQRSYDEYVGSSPNPSLLAILSLEPLSGAGILQVPLPLAMAVLDRLLGGNGAGSYPSRPLTDIEGGILREVLDRAVRELAHASESLVALRPEIVQVESNPQFAQVAAPSDMVVVMTFDTRIGSQEGQLSLCIPFSSLQPVLDRATSHSLFGERGPADSATAVRAMQRAIEEVPVELALRFPPVTLTSREVVDLQPGDVLPLSHATDQPLLLTVGDLTCVVAVPGRKGKRLACRVVAPVAEGQS